MIDKLEEIEIKFERLTAELSDPEVLGDTQRLTRITRERSRLEAVVEAWRGLRNLREQLEETRELLEDSDADIRSMAREELPQLQEAVTLAEEQLRFLLLPRDPNDDKDVIVEIRAGTGGDEAALFAGELMRAYIRFAEHKGWSCEVLNLSSGGAGGVKEVAMTIQGEEVYSSLKFESGVHRVQRVPATETQGRLHTSTVTVAVLPEVDEVEVKINPADLEWEAMRSTGAGGQSVNTTDSAVRVTHKPTGIVVRCEQERSQHKNRAQALRLLRAKVHELEESRIKSERDADRRSQVGSGERSEKIRTYNFPQDRVTDHRISLTLHNLPGLMDGELDELFTTLRTRFQAERLKEEGGGSLDFSS